MSGATMDMVNSVIRASNHSIEGNIFTLMFTKRGYPRKVGQLGVGHVLYGTEFRHEFSHPTEDRPTWDCGRKAV